MGTAPPVRHRLGEIPQRLLLHRLRTRPQPLICGPRLGQLLAALPARGSDTAETSQPEANRAP
jgi:hypothetical protein